MRILQVVHGFPPESIAGTERYCEAVVQCLLKRGHECVVLAGSGRDDTEATLAVSEQDGLLIARYRRAARRPYRWTDEYDADAERLVRRLLALVNPDVVHLHHWLHLTSNLAAICADLEIPVVITLHDVWTSCPRIYRIRPDDVFCEEPPATAPCLTCVERTSWQGDGETVRALTLRREIVEAELALAKVVMVPSEAHRRLILTLLDLPDDRVTVLPHGTFAALTGRKDHEENGAFPQRPLQIGHWGYLMHLKGTHLILEAVHRLRDPSSVHVHLIGSIVEPEYQQRLQELACGISVQFHGAYHPADLQAFDLDLAVFASIASESYSFALDEALCLGLPVIVSDRGALPERIGGAGLTFRVGDPDDLAQRLQDILDTPQMLNTMRRQIQPEKFFSMERHIAMLEKTYEDAVQSAQPRREPGTPYLKLIAHIQQQVQEREAALAVLQSRLAESERMCDEKETRLQQAAQALTEKETRLQQAEQALESLRVELESLRVELENLRRTPLFKLQAVLTKRSPR